MNKIISKEYFSANVVKFDVEAPLIAKARKAGHFVIVRTGEKGERIPLTITSSDPERAPFLSSYKPSENRHGNYVPSKPAITSPMS